MHCQHMHAHGRPGVGVLPAHARARPTRSTSLGGTARACTRTAGPDVCHIGQAGCHLLLPEHARSLIQEYGLLGRSS